MKVTLMPAELEILRGRTDNPETLKAIEALDQENLWREKLNSEGLDQRIWSIVASIAERQAVRFNAGTHITVPDKDLMGYSHFSLGKEMGVKINGIKMTSKGWGIAKPNIQKALDVLGTVFDAGCSGLVCRQGTYMMEEIFTDHNGYKYRSFDARHQPTGVEGLCFPVYPILRGERDAVQVWERISELPYSQELICVDGMAFCKNCGQPIRQEKYRTGICH